MKSMIRFLKEGFTMWEDNDMQRADKKATVEDLPLICKGPISQAALRQYKAILARDEM